MILALLKRDLSNHTDSIVAIVMITITSRISLIVQEKECSFLLSSGNPEALVSGMM